MHGRTRSAWRFGGSAEGESGTEALRGASAPGGGRPYATLLGPSSRRRGFITTWRWETECMLLSRYGDTDPPCLMRLPSAPEWRMMWRAAHEGRRPLPSLLGCTEALAGPGIHRTRMRRAAAEWRQRGDRRAPGTGDRGTTAWICTTGVGWRSCNYGYAFELGLAPASGTASGNWASESGPGRSSRWGYPGPHLSCPGACAHKAGAVSRF